MTQGRFVIPFSQLRMTDVDIVGGKNASLGELLSQLTEAGIRVPDGFATTAEAFRVFLKEGGLDKRIEDRLSKLDDDDVKELARQALKFVNGLKKLLSRLSSKKKSENTMSGSRATRRKFPLLFVPLQLLKIFRTLPLPASRKLT